MKLVLLLLTYFKILLHSVSAEGSANPIISGQGLEKDTSNDCDVVITDQYGDIRSPGYPGKYPRYSRCHYSIKRYSANTCEVKLTLERFEVAKMTFSNCSADFLELQSGRKRYKMCGELPAGTKRFVMFPDNSDWLEFKFQSTFHQMKGFAIEVKQLPFSCKKAMNSSMIASMQAPPPCIHVIDGRSSRITFPTPSTDGGLPAEKCSYHIKKSEDSACVVQLDFSSFDVARSPDCETDHLKLPDGQKLCGTLGGSTKLIHYPPNGDELILEFTSSTGKSNSFDMQIKQLPGPCQPEAPSSNTTVQHPTVRALRQCDQIIKDTKGRITSPGFPAAFGPNYRCTYQIFRPDPSVCQIELEFLTFSLGRHNPPGCWTGSYLELPGRHRLCHDTSGKMILKVSEFKDPVVFHFHSDARSSGRGFDILTHQIPNTCPGYAPSDIPSSSKRCYQEVSAPSGYFSSSHIRPHFPMRSPMWCEFVVRRSDPAVCRVKLQISSKSFLDLPCTNNFIHLPGGDRMCISVTETRELRIPDGSNYITLVYYNTNNPEFNLFVEQISNSCESENQQSNRSQNRRWGWRYLPQ